MHQAQLFNPIHELCINIYSHYFPIEYLNAIAI